MLQPLLFLIGLAGAAFMIYAFHVMKLLNRTARILAISGLMLLTILFGNQIFAPRQYGTAPNSAAPNFLPFIENNRVSPRAVPGWQETPFIVLELILAEIANFGGSVPATPSPTTPAPSPPDQLPSPAPATPPASPPASPVPSSPAPSPVQPTPTPSPTPPPSPDPYPDRYPDNPYPDDPYPGDPYPGDPYPAPTPTPNPNDPDFAQPAPGQPRPARPRPSPIPGWW